VATKHIAATGVLLALLAVAVTGCGGKSTSSTGASGGGGGQISVAGVSANDHGSRNVSSSAEVELNDYYFKPTVLRGGPGSAVTLDLKNVGSVEHNFSIPGQNIDENIQPGQDVKVSVTIPKSGVVAFFCKFHKAQGMVGALEAGGSGGMTGTEGGTTTGTTTGGGYYNGSGGY
jgi:plastocyanin